MSNAGQPLKFKDVDELGEKIELYFQECDKDGKPYTVSGLAYALGTNRQTLLNYQKADGYEEYFDTIKKAKQRIEAYVEERLFGNAVSGVIFNLKNNFGWRDKQEIDLTHTPHENALDELE